MLEFQAGMHLPDVTIVLKKSGNALFAIPRHVCNEFIRLHHSNLGNALSSPKCTASYNLVSLMRPIFCLNDDDDSSMISMTVMANANATWPFAQEFHGYRAILYLWGCQNAGN